MPFSPLILLLFISKTSESDHSIVQKVLCCLLYAVWRPVAVQPSHSNRSILTSHRRAVVSESQFFAFSPNSGSLTLTLLILTFFDGSPRLIMS